MLLYIITTKPMFDRLGNAFLMINEFVIYFTASLTYAFTDYTSNDVDKY